MDGQRDPIAAPARFTLVCIYGPPAAGKLTVATALSLLTGAKVLHNHLTSDVVQTVLQRGTPAFRELVERLRLNIIEAAARAGVDLICTLGYCKPQDDRYLRSLEEVVRSVGGVLRYVQLRPGLSVLEERVVGESRGLHAGKVRDVARLRESLAVWDVYSLITPDDLSIDNSALTPDEVAATIRDTYQLQGTSIQ